MICKSGEKIIFEDLVDLRWYWNVDTNSERMASSYLVTSVQISSLSSFRLPLASPSLLFSLTFFLNRTQRDGTCFGSLSNSTSETCALHTFAFWPYHDQGISSCIEWHSSCPRNISPYSWFSQESSLSRQFWLCLTQQCLEERCSPPCENKQVSSSWLPCSCYILVWDPSYE